MHIEDCYSSQHVPKLIHINKTPIYAEILGFFLLTHITETFYLPYLDFNMGN